MKTRNLSWTVLAAALAVLASAGTSSAALVVSVDPPTIPVAGYETYYVRVGDAEGLITTFVDINIEGTVVQSNTFEELLDPPYGFEIVPTVWHPGMPTLNKMMDTAMLFSKPSITVGETGIETNNAYADPENPTSIIPVVAGFYCGLGTFTSEPGAMFTFAEPVAPGSPFMRIVIPTGTQVHLTGTTNAGGVIDTMIGPSAHITLYADEQATVDSFPCNVTLYDSSRVFIVSGAGVPLLDAFDISNVDISDGSVSTLNASGSSNVDISGGAVSNLYASGSSTVDMSDGAVSNLYASDLSTIDISDGSVSNLYASGASTVNISGGSISDLYASDSSTLTLNVRDFWLGAGLTLAGNRLLGTGVFSGEWMDDPLHWTIDIGDTSGCVLVVPEPPSLAILLGGLLSLLPVRRRLA